MTPPPQTDTLLYSWGEDALSFSYFLTTRAGTETVTRFRADSDVRHCMIARRQTFSLPYLHALKTSSLQGLSLRHDWFILSHSITRSSPPTRSFGVRLHSESRKHRCNDFLQKVQNSERTVKNMLPHSLYDFLKWLISVCFSCRLAVFRNPVFNGSGIVFCKSHDVCWDIYCLLSVWIPMQVTFIADFGCYSMLLRLYSSSPMPCWAALGVEYS